MKDLNVSKNFSARVEIADLEQRGWDFTYFYQDVSDAQQISAEDAEKWEKENYCVSIDVDADGKTFYATCQKAHYGSEIFNQGYTGDSAETIKDLQELNEKGLLWDCKQTN